MLSIFLKKSLSYNEENFWFPKAAPIPYNNPTVLFANVVAVVPASLARPFPALSQAD